MTDVSQHIFPQIPIRQVCDHRSRRAAQAREYHAYFAVVFLFALPLAFLAWALKAVRRVEWPEIGPVRSAWSQASIITPTILSA